MIVKTLTLYILLCWHGFRKKISPNEKSVEEDARIKFTMKPKDLQKPKRLREKQNMYNMSSPSSLRNNHREEWLYSYRRGKLKSQKELNVSPTERPGLLPPLPRRTLPGRIVSKRTDEFPTTAKTANRNILPKYLPKLEPRKVKLDEMMKEIDPASRRFRNAEKTAKNRELPPLRKRAVHIQPVRAALSTPATLRGLVTLDVEGHFVFRFRLSNYDVKDINIATLNDPV